MLGAWLQQVESSRMSWPPYGDSVVTTRLKLGSVVDSVVNLDRRNHPEPGTIHTKDEGRSWLQAWINEARCEEDTTTVVQSYYNKFRLELEELMDLQGPMPCLASEYQGLSTVKSSHGTG